MKGSKSKSQDATQSSCASLFPDLDLGGKSKARLFKRIEQPIWTENKAHFIQSYLRYFVQITKHGVYIDGFAGPQSFKHLDAWTASLVLESEPKWLRTFFLCEITKRGVNELRKLAEAQAEARDKKGRKIRRTIEVIHGDFNQAVDNICASKKISQREATFCLLDQRTFECHWATLKKLADYKQPPGNKIELLYFLGVGWLHRALSSIRYNQKMLDWWGQSNWRDLKGMRSYDISE
jgi:three-Cys-motif partner protein